LQLAFNQVVTQAHRVLHFIGLDNPDHFFLIVYFKTALDLLLDYLRFLRIISNFGQKHVQPLEITCTFKQFDQFKCAYFLELSYSSTCHNLVVHLRVVYGQLFHDCQFVRVGQLGQLLDDEIFGYQLRVEYDPLDVCDVGVVLQCTGHESLTLAQFGDLIFVKVVE